MTLRRMAASLIVPFFFLCCLGIIGTRLWLISGVVSFNERVYPGMTTRQLKEEVGAPAQTINSSNAHLLRGNSYQPDPDIPIENVVFVYYDKAYRFCVYISKEERVICVVTSRT